MKMQELLKIAEEQDQPSALTTKYVNRVVREMKRELKSRMHLGEKIVVTQETPLKFRFTIDFNQWHRPETIADIWDSMKMAIIASDEEGHIAKVEEGDGNGIEFVEALLVGLRPGTKVKAEAFFPTYEYVVTWKNIASSKG